MKGSGLSLLATRNYLSLSTGILLAFDGDVTAAVLLTYLINQHTYFEDKGQIGFFASAESIRKYTGISEKTQSRKLPILEGLGVLRIKRQGNPYRNWYFLQAEAIFDLYEKGMASLVKARAEDEKQGHWGQNGFNGEDTGHWGQNGFNGEDKMASMVRTKCPHYLTNTNSTQPKAPTQREVSKDTSSAWAGAAPQSDNFKDLPQGNPSSCKSTGGEKAPGPVPPDADGWEPDENFDMNPFDEPEDMEPSGKSYEDPRDALVPCVDMNVIFPVPDMPPVSRPPAASIVPAPSESASEAPAGLPQAPSGKPRAILPESRPDNCPRDLLREFLLRNKALFSQIQMKEGTEPSKTELRVSKWLNQIRHRVFLMQKFKPGWLEGKLNVRCLPGDPGGLGAMTWAEALAIVQASVDSLTASQAAGFDYPKRKPDGTREKIGLDAWLINQAPSGITAPWLGFLLGNKRPTTDERADKVKALVIEDYGEEIYKTANDLMLEIQKDRVWEPNQVHAYWSGVADLLEWRKVNRVALLGDADVWGGNMVNIRSPKGLLNVVRDWAVEGGGFLRWAFVGPEKPGWADFCAWAKSERNVNLNPKRVKKLWEKPRPPADGQ